MVPRRGPQARQLPPGRSQGGARGPQARARPIFAELRGVGRTTRTISHREAVETPVCLRLLRHSPQRTPCVRRPCAADLFGLSSRESYAVRQHGGLRSIRGHYYSASQAVVQRHARRRGGARHHGTGRTLLPTKDQTCYSIGKTSHFKPQAIKDTLPILLGISLARQIRAGGDAFAACSAIFGSTGSSWNRSALPSRPRTIGRSAFYLRPEPWASRSRTSVKRDRGSKS